MGTKTEPGRFDCLGNALPDEPFFVLLARDQQAVGLVLLWAAEREAGIAERRFPESDAEKVSEARALAERMKAWREQNDGIWRANNPELPLDAPHLTRAEAAEQAEDAALGLYGPQQPAPLFCQRNRAEGPRLFSPDFQLYPNVPQPRTADMRAVAEAQGRGGPAYPEH